MSALDLGADARFMAMALALGEAQLGRTAPNPAVGCVLAREGRVVGHGATGAGGRPHAEERALDMAGASARGATAYVTLEPCATRSAGTSSCSERLIAAGVARVVCAVADPHVHAGGRGLARLAAAGVIVRTSVGALEAARQHAGFFRVVREGLAFAAVDDRPWAYDGRLIVHPDETLAAALRRAAAQGQTRLYAPPGSREAGLLSAG